MTAIEYAAWGTVAFSWIGMFVVAKWVGGKVGMMAWKIDCWSDRRAFMLCAHAIVAYEFKRGRRIGPSIKYALKIMRGE